MKKDEEIVSMLLAKDGSEPAARLDDVRAAALHARIMATASARLADLRQQRTWWDYSARWSRAAVPVGLAASILAGAIWYRAPVETSPDPAAAAMTSEVDAAQRTMQFAVAGLGSSEMLDSLVGPVSRDALVNQMLGGSR